MERIAQIAVGTRGQGVRVRAEHVMNTTPLEVVCKHVNWIPTKKRDAATMEKLIPTVLQPNRGLGLASFPEHADHLTIRTNARIRCAWARKLQGFANCVLKAIPVRLTINHKPGKHLMSIEHSELPFAPGKHDIGAQPAEVARKALPTLTRRDDQ